MVILTEVAEKLQNILNGTDSEVVISKPNDYDFVVLTNGFHLDSVALKNKNFIPVYISQAGGDFDAVPNLNKSNYVVSVNIYFPVRFKDDFFALGEYLRQVFVATQLNYGTISGKCLSNISVANFGEIQNLDLTQFKEWVEQNYKMPISVFEMWMSMSFSLYLSSLGSGFIYSNAITYTLSYQYNGQTYTEDLVWVQSGTGLSNSPISQQKVGEDDFAKNVINITNYSKSFSVYIRDNEFWNILLDHYNQQDMSDLENLTLTKTYHLTTDKVYTFNQVLLSLNENVSMGSPLTCTISLGDLYA